MPTTDHVLLSTAELAPLELEPAGFTVRAAARSEDYDLETPLLPRVASWNGGHERVAVVDDEGRHTYADLLERATQLAKRLRRLDLGGAVVSLTGPRSAGMAVAWLAIDEIGAACLPLDLSWPDRRRAGAEQRAGASARLTIRAGCSFELERHTAGRSSWPDAEVPSYLLFTSGTTGMPKGAAVTRRGLLNHLLCKVQDLGIGPADLVAQTAPVSFDVSIWQLLAPLVAGAAVRVLPDEVTQSPPQLNDELCGGGLTVVELVPSVLQMLARLRLGEENPSSAAAPPRLIIATGEPLHPGLAKALTEAYPESGLLNAYGPTECADDVTHHYVEAADLHGDRVSIGTPVANTQLYVLARDRAGWRATEPGEPGELFVGGAGVGMGYVNDHAATRNAFFKDPFGTQAGARLYRTGDLATSDGTRFWHLGRVDRQVKRRGVRIELEEIEAKLGSHPAVSSCAVVPVERGARSPLVARLSSSEEPAARREIALAGFFVSSVSTPGLEGLLKGHLRSELPETMVPDVLVRLSELPLNTNGKVDHTALSERGWPGPAAPRNLTPPRSEPERLVCGAYAEALELQAVGRDEDFLTLGGTSLSAMHIVSSLRAAAGWALTVADVLRHRTPAALARAVATTGSTRRREAAQGRRLGSDAEDNGPLRLSTQQEGLYFLWRLAPESGFYTYQSLLRMRGPFDEPALRAAWAELLGEASNLRCRFSESRGRVTQQLGAWECPLGATTDLSARADPAAVLHEHARRAAAATFDLLSEPCLRAECFKLGAEDHQILLTVHEILIDGVGATVLIRRLGELYAYHLRGSALGSPPTRFAEYLRWEAEHIRSADVCAQAEFWRRELERPTPVLELPSDLPRPSQPSYRGTLIERKLDVETVSSIDSVCAEAGVTRLAALLAAYGRLLGSVCGQDEVMIGLPMANRSSLVQRDVVGFLLNMLPVRVALTRDGRCTPELIRSAGAAASAALAASEVPFAAMLRGLRTARSTSHDPVFQTMLNFLNYSPQRSRFAGLSFDLLELYTGYIKYDIELSAQAAADGGLVLFLKTSDDLMLEDSAAALLAGVLGELRDLAAAGPAMAAPSGGLQLAVKEDR